MTTNASLTQREGLEGQRQVYCLDFDSKCTAHLSNMSSLEFQGHNHCIPGMQSLSMLMVLLPSTQPNRETGTKQERHRRSTGRGVLQVGVPLSPPKGCSVINYHVGGQGQQGGE